MAWKDLSVRTKRLGISLFVGIVLALVLLLNPCKYSPLFCVSIYGAPAFIDKFLFGTRSFIAVSTFVIILIFYTLLSFLYLSLLDSISNKIIKRIFAIILPILLLILNIIAGFITVGSSLV